MQWNRVPCNLTQVRYRSLLSFGLHSFTCTCSEYGWTQIIGGNVVLGVGTLCRHACLSACMSLFTCSLCCEVEGYGKGSSATIYTFCPCLNGVHCKWL